MLLNAKDRDAIAQLQFFAKGVVEGITAGRHRSPLKGSSIEFKEHRQYVQGDEIRTIDWKLYGKTDRLFIRQFEDETNLTANILLDQSGSMGYRGQRAGGLSKHQYAVRLSACLAALLVSQQDAVGVTTLDTAVRKSIPARSNPRHLRAIFELLTQSKSAGETSLGDCLSQAAGRFRRRGLIFLISDCFDDLEKLLSALRLFRHSGHEVIVFQIWDPDELDFPFRNRTEFRSLEKSAQHIVDPQSLRKSYLKRVHEFRQQLELETAKQRIELLTCTTDIPCGEMLGQYISLRQRSLRGQPGRNRRGAREAKR